MLAVCSNVCQFFTDRHDGHIAFTLPPLTSSLRITSCHNHAEKRRVSIATVPQEPEGVLKKHSTETKQMLQELDKEVGETESTEQTITRQDTGTGNTACLSRVAQWSRLQTRACTSSFIVRASLLLVHAVSDNVQNVQRKRPQLGRMG